MSVEWAKRNYVHLKQLEEEYGTGNASAGIRALTSLGLEERERRRNAERAAEGKATKDYPYVSDAGDCSRKIWFSLRNAEKTNPTSDDSLINMEMGNRFENLTIDLWEMAGATVNRQVRVEIPALYGPPIVGKVDAEIHLDELLRQKLFDRDGARLPEWFLVEDKAKNLFAFDYIFKDFENKTVANRKQTNLYLYASQNGLTERAYDKAMLCYGVTGATKGTPMLHGFWIKYDPQMAETDIGDLSRLKQMADTGVDPGIPFDRLKANNKGKLHPLCANYCSYRTLCWGE